MLAAISEQPGRTRQFREFVLELATLHAEGDHEAVRDAVRNLAADPAALVETYATAAEYLRNRPAFNRDAEGMAGLGFLGKIFDGIKHIAGEVKDTIQEVAPVAAPFVSLIPGAGPAAAALSAAAGIGPSDSSGQRDAMLRMMPTGQTVSTQFITRSDAKKLARRVVNNKLREQRRKAAATASTGSPNFLLFAGIGLVALLALRR